MLSTGYYNLPLNPSAPKWAADLKRTSMIKNETSFEKSFLDTLVSLYGSTSKTFMAAYESIKSFGSELLNNEDINRFVNKTIPNLPQIIPAFSNKLYEYIARPLSNKYQEVNMLTKLIDNSVITLNKLAQQAQMNAPVKL